MQLASKFFAGGRDDATVTINGVGLRVNAQFVVGVSSSATAENLKDAINASRLSSFLTAAQVATAGNLHKVTLASSRTGTLYNFGMSASTPAVGFSDSGNMVGGSNPAWALGGNTLDIPSHGMTTGIGSLYTEGSLAKLLISLFW